MTPIDFLRILYRLLFVQATWNYERMLSLGFCFSAAPFIKKIFSGAAQRADFLRRNSGFFNTHPYFASYILGVVLKLEKQSLHGEPVRAAEIEKVKTHLSRSLAAVGDVLFWRCLKPIAAMLGMLLALYHVAAGVSAFLFIYNIPHLLVRSHGLRLGYRLGFDLVKTAPLAQFHSIIDFLNKAGSFLCGIVMVYFLNTDKTLPNFREALAFICGLILMVIFIKWKVPVPYTLAILLILGLLSGLFL